MTVSATAVLLSADRLFPKESMEITFLVDTDAPTSATVAVRVFGEGTIAAVVSPPGAVIQGDVVIWTTSLPAGQSSFIVSFRTAARPYQSIGAVVGQVEAGEVGRDERVVFFGLSSELREEPPVPPSWEPGAVSVARMWGPTRWRVEPGQDIRLRLEVRQVWGANKGLQGWWFTRIFVADGPVSFMTFVFGHPDPMDSPLGVSGDYSGVEGVWRCSIQSLVTFQAELFPTPLGHGNRLEFRPMVGVGVDVPVPVPPTGAVEGHVRDAATLGPIARATVTVDGLSTTTDAEGFYTFPEVPAGTRTVQASAIGHRSGSQTVAVPGGAIVVVDFVLEPVTPGGGAGGLGWLVLLLLGMVAAARLPEKMGAGRR